MGYANVYCRCLYRIQFQPHYMCTHAAPLRADVYGDVIMVFPLSIFRNIVQWSRS